MVCDFSFFFLNGVISNNYNYPKFVVYLLIVYFILGWTYLYKGHLSSAFTVPLLLIEYAFEGSYFDFIHQGRRNIVIEFL